MAVHMWHAFSVRFFGGAHYPGWRCARPWAGICDARGVGSPREWLPIDECAVNADSVAAVAKGTRLGSVTPVASEPEGVVTWMANLPNHPAAGGSHVIGGLRRVASGASA